ncbi:hypothetical protein MHLP_01905 [Candidatus Mycoplasma haematolamae str. Purdue]|uniref:Uncharacterized protein n=1 Tax=Mycoplasma haematolamae (strain Purdue) TaxID=1212765 RepID=I7CFI1_MYCHA|nr:DUF5385 family protein [Candidatus Mycoplasma haematolamae]AFO51961.1 hypothetical protein MHLP_01905 [Candidatus Mycoplasma haematolamae str. Purdue]
MLFLNSFSPLLSFLPIVLVVFSFWLIARKKQDKQRNISRKDDVWYVVKEYLKLTDRQGYRLADLSLYPRPKTIASLREYVDTTRRTLQEENSRLLGLPKEKKPWKVKLTPDFVRRKNLSFPKEEEYHKKLELTTLEVISEKLSDFQLYLQAYNSLKDQKEFQELLKQFFICEAIPKISKRRSLLLRSRYLVCFRTISRSGTLSEWEAIEIELFKNPKKRGKEKYKILFTAAVDYRKELHWIYSMQLRYFKDKIEARKNSEKHKANYIRRQKVRAFFGHLIFENCMVKMIRRLRNPPKPKEVKPA